MLQYCSNLENQEYSGIYMELLSISENRFDIWSFRDKFVFTLVVWNSDMQVLCFGDFLFLYKWYIVQSSFMLYSLALINDVWLFFTLNSCFSNRLPFYRIGTKVWTSCIHFPRGCSLLSTFQNLYYCNRVEMIWGEKW